MVRHDVNQETGNPRALTEALRLIRERSVSTGDVDSDTVLIMAAADADGVCSAHILTSILKLEGIRYTLHSVNSYTEMEEGIRNLNTRVFVRTVVLLNCGAVIDLTKPLQEVASDVVVVVIDSHRPIHLKNVKESARILVLDDDLGRGGYFPAEILQGDADDQDDDDTLLGDLIGDDEDSEEEEEMQEDQYDDDGNLIHHKSKRQRVNDPLGPSREARKKIIREYYEGFYFGSPSALVLYAMASDMGYQTQQLLWLACVGLASYMESGSFSPDTFRGIANEVDNHYLSPSLGGTGNEENVSSQSQNGGGHGGLRFVEDLRLTMYMHWSLFQAMWYTPYVYTKLELHRDHGHGTMQKLLMFAGISPENYNQTFSSMSHSARKLVASDKFKRKCAAFGMDDIKHYQFIRTVRMKDEERPSLMLNELAASDMYYMITTAIHTKGFNYAMDVAVNAAPLSEMHACISSALDVHKDICIQAKMILDKRAWRLVDGFRFCVLDKPTSAVFQQSPPAVRWLAMFLMSVLQHRKQSAALLPLLMCVKSQSGASYICLGADPQDTKSEFVFRFRNACEATAVKIQLNSFDFALAEVPSADFESWSLALLGADETADADDESEEEEMEEEVAEDEEGEDDVDEDDENI